MRCPNRKIYLETRVADEGAFTSFLIGDKKYYFHGNDTNNHICKCGYDNSCKKAFGKSFDCNCNAMAPTKVMDKGSIRSMTDLPITSFAYGPITAGLGKIARIKVGPLKCKGTNSKRFDPFLRKRNSRSF